MTNTAQPAATPPARKRLSPARREAQLLTCALTAFAQAGIERAVHADVAALAGVSVPTVFKYFPTRDALVDAVLSRIETEVFALLKSFPENTAASPGQTVKLLAAGVNAMCENTPDLVKTLLSWSVAFSSVRPRFLVFQDECLTLVQARLSTRSQDRSDARILLGAAFLYEQMYFDGSTADVRQRYVERMADLLDKAQD